MKTKIKLLAIALAATMLAGCEERLVHSERRVTVKVVSVYLTSKSNSKVTLQDIKTGHVYKDERLSCRKEDARKVKIGSLWDVYETTYITSESRRFSTDLDDVSAICRKSK